MITQLKEEYSPYMMGQHYMAHRTTLVVQALSNLLMVVKLEKLLQSLYSYFSSSPKQHLEFTKLLEFVKTRGLKILQNVKTFWISFIRALEMCVDKV
jgi:hypothetical protein